MSWFYTIAYSIGVKPWETAATREAKRIAAIFDREEVGRERPFGPALDLGCGTGLHAVELARRGWQVTGVDVVPKALHAARERVREAGVDVRLVEADVTSLRAAGVGVGFCFVLDFGLFHGLRDAEREAVGREVTAVTVPGATMLTISWVPGRRGPLPRGASRGDIERAFPAWKTIAEEPLPASALPRMLASAAPRFYRLRRE